MNKNKEGAAMKRCYLRCLCIIIFTFTYCLSKEASSDRMSFLRCTVKDFVLKMTDKKGEQEAFLAFYTKIEGRMNATNDGRRRRSFSYYLNTCALKHMPINHPDWYEAIRPFIADINVVLDSSYNSTREIISAFLFKYGMYHYFHDQECGPFANTVVVRAHGVAQTDWLGKIKNYYSSSIAFFKDSAKKAWYYVRQLI